MGERLIGDGQAFFHDCNACICTNGERVCTAAGPCPNDPADGGVVTTREERVWCQVNIESQRYPGDRWMDGDRACRCSEIGETLCDPPAAGRCIAGERLVANGQRFYDGCNACRCADGDLACTRRTCGPGGSDTGAIICLDYSGGQRGVGATWTEGDRECRCSMIGDVICLPLARR